jgi:pyridoxine 5-phosphate synthase
MAHTTRLSINLNKVALLRNSRGTGIPNLVEVARTLIDAGCEGLTLHPRADGRHALLSDVRDLAALDAVRAGQVELNIEGDPRMELMAVAKEAKVHQFTLVPVRPGEITSDHGWRPGADETTLRNAVAFFEGRMRTSVFVDPDPEHVAVAVAAGADAIEIYTQPYAHHFGTAHAGRELDRIAATAQAAREHGLRVHAGHDLNLENLPALIERIQPEEVSIGHALVSEVVTRGLPGIAREYRRVIEASAQLSS